MVELLKRYLYAIINSGSEDEDSVNVVVMNWSNAF